MNRFLSRYAGLAVAGLLSLSAGPACLADYHWQNVAIGGGGCWVTGIAASVEHGKDAKNTLYIRTDCGGAYRWTGSGWSAITDWIPFEHRGDYSIESLAVNPSAGKEVYIACGGYLPDAGRDAGTIYKSTDYGAHWTQSFFNNAPVKRFDGSTGLSMAGNGERRWGGERLACDPGLQRHLLFGSREEGLWATSDDAATWTRVASVPSGTPGFGITAVAYDPRGNGNVYAAVEGAGIYRSTDHGATWGLITAQPSWSATVRRMSVSSDGNVWMTNGLTTSTSNQGNPDRRGSACIAEYLPGSNSYKLYNPVPGGAAYFVALAVNPDDPKNITGSASTNANSEADSSTFWHTTDEGATWTKLNAVQNSSLPWYKTSTYTVSSFLYDPRGDFGTPGSLWYTDGTGIWHTHGPISSGQTNFYSEERGHEELCTTSLYCPSSGPNEVLMGMMDQDGFASSAKDIASYPTHRLLSNITGPWSGITLGVAGEESNPLNMACIYSQNDFSGPYHLALSTDGGLTWKTNGYQNDRNWVDYLPQQVTVGGQTSSFVPMTLSVNSTDPNNIVVLGNCNVGGTTSLVSIYTTQGLATQSWQVSGGYFAQGTASLCALCEANCFLTADPMTSGVFYATNGGYVYKSVNGGKTFMRLSSPTDGKVWGMQKLQATPGKNGDLWYSADADKGSWQNHLSQLPDWAGLYHSRDGGMTWTKVPNVTRCLTFSLGAKSPNGNSMLYYYGRNNDSTATANTDTIYCSNDDGATWKSILNPSGPNMIGNYPLVMQASRQTYGRLFIGTSGRGVFYSTP